MNTKLKTVNIFAVLVVCLYFLASGIVTGIILAVPSFASEIWLQTLLIYLLAFGLPSLIYGVRQKKNGQRFSETFSFRRIPLSSVLLCIAIGFLIQPVMTFIGSLASLVFQDITSSSMMTMADMPLWLYVLTIGVLPAFFEELTCRGMLLDGYSQTPLWYMIVIPALYFGLLHLNFQQASYALAAGLLLALLVKITNSIWSSMLVHFVVNGFQSLYAWLLANTAVLDGTIFGADTSELTGLQTVGQTLIWAACAAPLLILCLRALARKHHFAETKMRIQVNLPRNWQEGSVIMYVLLGVLFLFTLLVEFIMPLLNLS